MSLYQDRVNEAKRLIESSKSTALRSERKSKAKKLKAHRIESDRINAARKKLAKEIKREKKSTAALTRRPISVIYPWQARAIMDGECTQFREMARLMNVETSRPYFTKSLTTSIEMIDVGHAILTLTNGDIAYSKSKYQVGSVYFVAEEYTFVGLDTLYMTDYMPCHVDSIPAYVLSWRPRIYSVLDRDVEAFKRISIRITDARLVMQDHPVDYRREGVEYYVQYISSMPHINRNLRYWARAGLKPRGGKFGYHHILPSAAKTYALGIDDNLDPIRDWIGGGGEIDRYSSLAKTQPRWLYSFEKVTP